MNINEELIIDKRLGASINETWTEYLYLKRLSDQIYELSVRRHCILADAAQYADKKLPKTIKGKVVSGIDQNKVIGEELIFLKGKKTPIQFDHFSPNVAMQWLHQVEWFHKEIWSSLGSAIKKGQ